MKKVLWTGMFFLVFVLTSIGTGYAQCGASLSSCKTCHEVKREQPVMTKGEWHKDHSFGDFCEFCHGGNTAATAEAEAHQGMSLNPVKQPGNTCSSCHPDDYNAEAQKYASILHISIDESGGGSEPQATATSQDTTGPAAAGSGSSAGTETETASSTISVPSGGEVVDFNQLLTEETAPAGINTGNLILVILILGLAVVFLGMYWAFNRETIKEKLHHFLAEPAGEEEVDIAEASGPEEPEQDLVRILERQPALKRLVIQLKEADPTVVESLVSITGQNGDSEKLIKSLARIDLQLLKSLQRLKDGELDVLLTLAKKM